MMGKELKTCKCIKGKCWNWSRRCKKEYEDLCRRAEKAGKPAPKLICKYPYPGANKSDNDSPIFLPPHLR